MVRGLQSARGDREIAKLRRQKLELEADIAALRGSLALAVADEPTLFEWNVPPNAPGHEET
jgi:hypothetical protein